jgi:two-component system, response regulator PdtaR
VVEGDPLLRRNAVGTLGESGYEVLEVEDANAALRLLRAHGDEVVALFTDLDVSGTRDELAQAAHERWPHIRCFLRDADIRDSGHFIDKPKHGWRSQTLTRHQQLRDLATAGVWTSIESCPASQLPLRVWLFWRVHSAGGVVIGATHDPVELHLRIRRTMIVALVPKLVIALWRDVTQGLVPEGSVIRD